MALSGRPKCGEVHLHGTVPENRMSLSKSTSQDVHLDQKQTAYYTWVLQRAPQRRKRKDELKHRSRCARRCPSSIEYVGTLKSNVLLHRSHAGLHLLDIRLHCSAHRFY